MWHTLPAGFWSVGSLALGPRQPLRANYAYRLDDDLSDRAGMAKMPVRELKYRTAIWDHTECWRSSVLLWDPAIVMLVIFPLFFERIWMS